MAGTDSEKTSQEKQANSRYSVCVLGGDAIFLLDHQRGHKLYMGVDKPLTRLALRDYVMSINQDLNTLPMSEFLAKYGLEV